jgi:hypothetical protein
MMEIASSMASFVILPKLVAYLQDKLNDLLLKLDRKRMIRGRSPQPVGTWAEAIGMARHVR